MINLRPQEKDVTTDSFQCCWTSCLEQPANRRTSDSRTCHTAISDSRWRRFLYGQWDQSAVWIGLNPFNCVSEIFFFLSNLLGCCSSSSSGNATTTILLLQLPVNALVLAFFDCLLAYLHVCLWPNLYLGLFTAVYIVSDYGSSACPK